jgi:GT2 family glycosyltransferase
MNPVPAVCRIAVLLACHNRREKTVECLESLRLQQSSEVNSAPCQLEIFLLDDGSSDGTAEAALAVWPDANIIPGDGSLFWCGGMRVAWTEAAKTDPDYYLLVNDDTVLDPRALVQLIAVAPSPDDRVIAVAPILDPATGAVVFGGHVGHTGVPLQPNGQVQPCDTMNANCALIPRAVVRRIGMFHEAYTHAMGDFDYGFEASRAGMPVLLAPRTLGTSTPNPNTGTWRDRSLPKMSRLRLLWFSPKNGLPFLEWCTYCWRNHGWQWPLRCVSPTLRVLFR